MNTNETLRYGIIGGLFLVPFIPFVVTGSMLFPFISGKNFLFRIIVLIVTALWVVLMLRDKEYRPKRGPLLYTFLFFISVMAISTITAENSHKAFWSNFERMEGYIGLIHLFLYFVVLSSVVHLQKMWNKLWGVWIGASVIMCIYGTIQLAGKLEIHQGGARVDGTLGNAIYLAVYLMSLIFMAVFLFLRASNKKNAAMVLLPVILYQAIILYYTATRGAILGLIGGVIVTALIVAIGERKNLMVRKVAIGAVALTVLFVGLFVSMRNSEFVQESPVLQRFASLSISDIKTQGRFFIWPMAIEGFKERPIFGWGQEGFNYVFNKHYVPEMYAQEQWFDRAHSAPLDWLVAGGILGFLGYIGLFLFALWVIWKDANSVWSFSEKSLLTGFLAAYFFQSIFVFDNLVSYLMFFTFIAMVHSLGSSTRIHIPEALTSDKTRPVVGAVVLISLIFGLYFFDFKPMSAGQNLISAISIANTPGGNPEESLSYFEKVFAADTLVNTEAREQLAAAVTYFLGENTSAELKNRYGELALKEMSEQFKETPNDTRSYLVWGSFLRSIGRNDDALTGYKKALELSPKKQITYFEIGTLYLQTGRASEGLPWFKEAYELEPNYPEAVFLYATAAQYAGENELANELFKKIPENSLYQNDRYAQMLFDMKRYDELVKVFERRIADGNDSLDNTISLAAVYLQMGERGNAVMVLKRYRNNHPSEQAQMDYYISEIEAGRNP
jgi:O-antigen ligase/tetratricopeptide (TPR) repeat protein